MPDQKQSILLGGLVTALLSTSYLGFINCLCCAGVIIGSLVTVWHYTNTHELTITSGNGALLGLFTALIGGVIAIILNYVLMQVGLGANEAIMNMVLNNFADQMPPEQVEAMEAQMEAANTFGAYIMNALFGLVITAIFGVIGGVIGAAVFKKGNGAPANELDIQM